MKKLLVVLEELSSDAGESLSAFMKIKCPIWRSYFFLHCRLQFLVFIFLSLNFEFLSQINEREILAVTETSIELNYILLVLANTIQKQDAGM